MLFLAILCSSPAAARAATYYWDADGGSGAPNTLNYGNGTISTTSGNWWNPGNGTYIGWTNSSADVMQIGSNSAQDGRSYTGGSSAASFTLTLSGSISLGEIVISGNLSSGSANSVTFTDGGTAGNDMTFGGAEEINNNSSNTLIIDTTIVSAGGTFMFEDLGKTILTKNNGWTTGTIIEGDGSSTSGGILQVGNGGTTGALGTGQIQFPLAASQTTAATLDFDRSNADSVPNSINIPNTNTVGAIIEQSGSNTLTLTGTENISSSSATLTYMINPTGQTIDASVSGAISGAGGIAKSGAGTLALSGDDNYTGATAINNGTLSVARAGTAGNSQGGTLGATTVTVNTGGTLLLSANNALGGNTNVTLASGAFKDAGGFGEGAGGKVVNGTYSGTTTAGMGALTLSAASTLDFGGTVETLVFNSFTDSSNATLTIANYTNTDYNSLANDSGIDGSDDRLIFDQDLTAQQLADISFGTGRVTTEIEMGTTGYYEVGAVPEPTTLFGALALVGLAGYRERRRLNSLLK